MKPFLALLFASLLIPLFAISQTKSDALLKPSLEELPVVQLSNIGFDADSIHHLIDLINQTPPNDFRGMVILKENQLVVEEYFNTYWRSTIHDIRSATKSITALLLGIAIDKGIVESVDQSIYDFFPEGKYPPPPTPQHRSIKIKHLLNMTAGLDADTYDINSTGHALNWLGKEDWITYLLQIPIDTIPGIKWAYADACTMLIGAIIEERAGVNLATFAEQHLFKPLNIKEYYWFKSPQQRTGAMGNLYISTLDFAKIGQLVLNLGKWQEQRVISSEWIIELTRAQVDISDTNPFAQSYGYFWYRTIKYINNRHYECLFASGLGGNILVIVPSANMVVALTSSAYGQDYGHFRSNNILEYILKALRPL